MRNQGEDERNYYESQRAMLQEIERARSLREDDELEDSQAILLGLLDSYPDDPVLLFEVGGSFDVLGEEPQAIPYYQKAIEAGLDGDDLQECLVCLGSSLRYTGRADEAVEVLEAAVDEYPGNGPAQVFLALAYYSDGRHEEALRTLLSVLLETTRDEEILGYRETLEYYSDNLDEEWE